MARPIKKGLEYYTQDSDMFNDRNIRVLSYTNTSNRYATSKMVTG